nr:MAG TPA: hypothetical protein [Caudoviricetes sp.]
MTFGTYHKGIINSLFLLIYRYSHFLFFLMKITFAQLRVLHLHPNFLSLFAISS